MTVNSPKIAVVIPLYNKELSVARAVNSVLNQTVDFQKLIIVNDGSTDNSLDVVKQFTDPRIVIHSQANQGVSVARNTGVTLANADYICFLDADDAWLPHFLEEIFYLINMNKKAGLLCTRFTEVDEDSEEFVGKLVGITKEFRGELSDFFVAYRNNRSLFHPSASCVKYTVFNMISCFPKGVKIGEDIYLALQLALNSPVMFSTKKSSTIFRNAENRTNIREKLVIPYHIEYFLDPNRKQILEKNPTLKEFVLYNTVIFGLYAVQTANRKLAIKIATLLLKYSSTYAIIVFLGACLPKWCINVLKKWRNQKTLSYEN